MNKQEIIEVIGDMSKKSRVDFIWELIDRFDITICAGDDMEDVEPETMCSVTITEVPDSARKDVVEVLRFYYSPLRKNLTLQEIWNETKNLPLIMSKIEYEDDADEMCKDIEEAGGKSIKKEIIEDNKNK